MAATGIARIDALFTDAPGTAPLAPGDADRPAVGAMQDLLSGFGNRQLPDVRSPSYGNYGPMTASAVQNFRASAGLPAGNFVDAPCLQALVTRTPVLPMACRAYLALTLDLQVDEMMYLTTLTGLWECNARFPLLNLNTDRAGLSFGVIQWAQKPGRLTEILSAFRTADVLRFEGCFGGNGVAAGLLAHVAKANGGLNASTGTTIDPAFDLISPPWTGRFQTAGLDPVFQRVQMTSAAAAAQNAWDQLSPKTTLITSQRGIGFLLDVANQHGPAGALSIYTAVVTPLLDEQQLLQAMRDESVRRVSAQFGAGSAETQSTASRRDWFLTTTVL